MIQKRFIFLAIIFLVGIYKSWTGREVQHAAGVLIDQEPQQKQLLENQKSWKFKNAILTPQADYEIHARVLSAHSYWLGRGADLMPVDLAVGWKQMSDTSVINKLSITQADRFYFYDWEKSPPRDPEILRQNSSNMHLIPGNDFIKEQIKKIRKGQIIFMKGQLVNINFSDGEEIKSSLSRDDSGAGACEVMYVTSIEVKR